MAVVITIIGLIIGSIVAGASMIRNARIAQTITQLSQISDGINQFRDKYQQLPGDMYNATSYWGTNAACPSQPSTKHKDTCNGDGSGYIENGNESFYAWQHLADAGMINGTYSGSYTVGTPRPGVDCLPASIGGCFGIGFIPANRGGSWQLWADHYPRLVPIHIVSLGNIMTSHSYEEPYPPLTGSDVRDIDAKIDDGAPATGNITTRPGYCLPIAGEPCFYPSPCITDATETALYNTATFGDPCNLDFTLSF